VKEARKCKLQWEKRNVASAATRVEYSVVLRVSEKATREVWGLKFVAAGGLTIMHHLRILDYLPTERELQLNSMHRAKRQWTQMFNIWLWVELTLLCDGRVKTLLLWRRNFLLNFSTHPVFKMWIIQEPKKLALWNKRRFEEKKAGECAECLKYSVRIFIE